MNFPLGEAVNPIVHPNRQKAHFTDLYRPPPWQLSQSQSQFQQVHNFILYT